MKTKRTKSAMPAPAAKPAAKKRRAAAAAAAAAATPPSRPAAKPVAKKRHRAAAATPPSWLERGLRRPTSQEFVDRVMDSYLAKRSAAVENPIPPASTEFPASWDPFDTKFVHGTPIRAARVPSGHIASDWFVGREKIPQGCGKLVAWATEIAGYFADVARTRYGSEGTILMCFAVNGDVVFAVLPPDGLAYLDACCVVVAARDVPTPCDGCQTAIAKQKINVRVPDRSDAFGFDSRKAPVN